MKIPKKHIIKASGIAIILTMASAVGFFIIIGSSKIHAALNSAPQTEINTIEKTALEEPQINPESIKVAVPEPGMVKSMILASVKPWINEQLNQVNTASVKSLFHCKTTLGGWQPLETVEYLKATDVVDVESQAFKDVESHFQTNPVGEKNISHCLNLLSSN